MTWYDIDLIYDLAYGANVTVEADNVEEVCRRAIEKADDTEAWKSTDHASDAYVHEISPPTVWSRPTATPRRFRSRTPTRATDLRPRSPFTANRRQARSKSRAARSGSVSCARVSRSPPS